jgi:hypothetical protein
MEKYNERVFSVIKTVKISKNYTDTLATWNLNLSIYEIGKESFFFVTFFWGSVISIFLIIFPLQFQTIVIKKISFFFCCCYIQRNDPELRRFLSFNNNCVIIFILMRGHKKWKRYALYYFCVQLSFNTSEG